MLWHVFHKIVYIFFFLQGMPVFGKTSSDVKHRLIRAQKTCAIWTSSTIKTIQWKKRYELSVKPGVHKMFFWVITPQVELCPPLHIFVDASHSLYLGWYAYQFIDCAWEHVSTFPYFVHPCEIWPGSSGVDPGFWKGDDTPKFVSW